MAFMAEYLILSILGTLFIAITRVSAWRPWLEKVFKFSQSILAAPKSQPQGTDKIPTDSKQNNINDIMELAECHETAARLADLIRKDGAGTWPPRVNLAWPAALRPYMEVYQEMAPLLPAATASLDDEANRQRIDHFRSRFSKLLNDGVNLAEVTKLLDAADAGRWDVFPRDSYNAFYCCIAWCRHAYR